MLPQVPIFDPRKSYALTGETLNQWRDCLIRRVPLEGAGIEVDELPDGMLISSRAGSATLRLDFATSWTGAAGASDLQVRGGRVLGTDWTGFDPNDPLNAGWTEELATIATDELTVDDGETVWLAVSISSADHDSIGPLSANDTNEITVTGGGGGGGGGGGSGGGGGNTGADGSAGSAGSAGASGLGGAGGAGASSFGAGGTDTTGGDGAPGGQGGAGEAGVAGVEHTWFNYANAKLLIRVWTIDSLAFVVSATKPASDELTAHIPIASVDGNDIRQHQVGSITLTLPAVSYCPPEA